MPVTQTNRLRYTARGKILVGDFSKEVTIRIALRNAVLLFSSDVESLLKTLPAIMKAAGDSSEVAQAACFVAWKQIAGEGLRGNAVPLRLDDRTLVVAVADTAWQKQMQSLSGQLLFRLNSLLGQPVVTFLEFCEDRETVAQARLALAEAVKVQPPAPIPADLIAAAAVIEDEDLRRAFLGAATSCIRRVEQQ